MANLVNKGFTEFAAHSHNYLTWATDIKMMLTAKSFIDDINEPNTQAHISDTTKYNTLLLETSSLCISQDIGKRTHINFELHSKYT